MSGTSTNVLPDAEAALWKECNLEVILHSGTWVDRKLLGAMCQAIGISYSIAEDETDFAEKLRAAENGVGLVHVQQFESAARLKADPTFEDTPILIINSHSKQGRDLIIAAGLNAVFEFECPFSMEQTLAALKRFL
jgi:hypothetical protein